MCAVVVCAGAAASAQIWRGGYGGRFRPRTPNARTFAGGFNFCRLMFDSDRREKQGWSTDYPGADINLSIRLDELTRAPVTLDADGEPEYVVVRPTDDALFHCPFVIVEDGGTAYFEPDEIKRLREYLIKGGFLFVTDYHGAEAREQWRDQISRVLPEYPVVPLSMDHPVWHSLFEIREIPQMASIQSWRRTGGSNLERRADGPPDAWGISKDGGRLMVLMLHNTDIPDGWEREAEEEEYFRQYSPDAYAVGVNVVLYSMTH
jgi:hypothetical protein